ncbi:ribokinase [Flavobacteriaceae bacterium]|nr:ribokinase [Flavobacteriaceae bacterium]
MKSDIYIIGSSNTDMVIKSNSIPKPGETIIGGDFYFFQGGKGANQAVAASKLGGKVIFICKVGDDSLGNKSIKEYESHGINTEYICVEKGEHTGVALIMVDKEGENLISVASGANSKLKIKDIAFIEKKLKPNDLVLIQLEIPLEVVEFIISLCYRLRIKLILNPAPFQKIDDDYLKCIHTITPNMIEAESLTGIKVFDIDSSRVAAHKLIDKGIKNVFITMGNKGVFYITEDREGHILPKKVKAIDSTAAGDTFNGALAAALSFGMKIYDSVEFANSAASISVTKMGAQDSIPYINELEKKYRDLCL